mgnify:CR=1 FL=1
MRVHELIDILSDQPADAEVEWAVIAPGDGASEDLTVDRYVGDGVRPWQDAEDDVRATQLHDVVHRFDEPVYPQGALVELVGALAPYGAMLQRGAAEESRFENEGRAVVFSSLADLADRIDDPDLDVAPDDFLVLQNAGPKSQSGMPEAGYLPIPGKLAKQGVKDMVRLSDARMSGTAFGTIILHIAPEAATGGPLSRVRNGDRIRLSVKDRRLDLLVDDAELAKRKATADLANPKRGYKRLYADHVLQAPEGCDFDFLKQDAE